MTIRIEWALFRWAHTYGYSQVAGSLRDSRVSALIAKWSDVPSGADRPDMPERAWAAWRIDDYYVLVRSVPDQEEDRGGGYVSRALLLPVAQAEKLISLMPLFDLLEGPEHFWNTNVQNSIELSASPLSNEVVEAVSALLAAFAKRDTKRIVLLNSVQTPIILSGLWQTLWPAARLQLSFKTYYTPTQVSLKEGKPQLIISPTLAALWEAHDYEVITGTVQGSIPALVKHLIDNTSPLAKTLLKGYSGGLTDLPTLTVLYRQVETALQTEDTWGTLMAINTLERVSISVESRDQISAQLYQALEERIPRLPTQEFLYLAQTASLSSSLNHALESWITDRLLFEPDISKILEEPTEAWFRQTIEAGVAAISPSEAAANQVWAYWTLLRDQGVLPIFLSKNWEASLASTVPPEPPIDLEETALQTRLLRIYAVLIRRYPHIKAIQTVLRHVTPEDQLTIWVDLQFQWGKEAFIQAIAQLDAPELDPFVIETLDQEPDLLQFLNPTQIPWQRWWTQRVENGADVWQGIPDQSLVLENLLNLGPERWPHPVMAAIATTPQANLLHQPQRRKLWQYLPKGFLSTTASAWLDADVSPNDIEREVLEEVLSQVRMQLPPASAIKLLRLTAPWVDSVKLDLLLQSARITWPEDLVSVLQQRADQQYLAEGWYDKSLSGRYIFPAGFFDPLYERLRPMQQIRYLRDMGHAIPDQLWWIALREKSLATFGDELDRVWADIGGKAKHLEHQGSRESRWFHAIQRIKSKGRPSFGDLLRVIGREDQGSDDSKVLWEMRPYDT
ncbi:hypothetical protein [Deinococcus gobiensis]|uniref:Uncharacterized protein n=1 Tax=Deinococcus gobiensis (strain DSM 21396 / JCM 16679 / CGMCC 1.7299 / I-0) TaxID=745776 RepID=H8H2Y4_DEIGI|nr:hypothetical protein [Deinococcus gobiensis]AFD27881.1 hypothetical protein DGo_PC0089 [Deinococcus gobiensis I-0]